MREPGGANAVVHYPLHKYIKIFSIDFLHSPYIFFKNFYFGTFVYKNKKRQLIQSCLYSLLQVLLLVKLQLPTLIVLLNLVLQNYHH